MLCTKPFFGFYHHLNVLCVPHGPSPDCPGPAHRIHRQQIDNRLIFPAQCTQDILCEQTTQDRERWRKEMCGMCTQVTITNQTGTREGE